jgi:molybdopterin-containing oxidoreductase family membrane subunit
MAKLSFQKLDTHRLSFVALVTLHVAGVACGLAAALYMEHHGHIVTGMNNQIVWGLPHVFAVFLIVAASGALNVASVSSVFNRLAYKPYARLSGILAIALLIGGLSVLVLDLGRPDRLLVAMTTYNFRSIFAWNIYLYSGFVLVVAAYLVVMMDRALSQKPLLAISVGWLAFGWRLALTTGTGSIFGFLVAREAYDAAILAPLFIAASFLFGLAFTVLVLETMSFESRAELMPDEMLVKFGRLLIIFILPVLYLTVVQHLTKFYGSAHRGVELLLLRDGGAITAMFWIGQVLVGSLVPLVILAFAPSGTGGRRAIVAASLLVLFGGLAQFYVIIIGGQAYPLDLFPGMAASSSFGDGEVAHYVPSLPEVLLGVSGISLAMLITAGALKLMPFLPKAGAEMAAHVQAAAQ